MLLYCSIIAITLLLHSFFSHFFASHDVSGMPFFFNDLIFSGLRKIFEISVFAVSSLFVFKNAVLRRLPKVIVLVKWRILQQSVKSLVRLAFFYYLCTRKLLPHILMIDYQAIIDHYYPEAEVPELRHILMVHSKAVADKAAGIVDAHPEWRLDRDFVYAAAMLHDIGIIRCDAPGIHCHGTEPYIRHGVIGATLVQEFTVSVPVSVPVPVSVDYAFRIGRVCARHTGTGLPGLEPETLEEQIICYADKFFSKTKLDREKTYDEACRSLMKFGAEGVMKFEAWHKRFHVS